MSLIIQYSPRFLRFYIDFWNSGLVADSSNKDLGYWEEKIKKKEEAINRKAAKLEKIKEFLDSDCVDQCEDGTFGFTLQSR